MVRARPHGGYRRRRRAQRAEGTRRGHRRRERNGRLPMSSGKHPERNLGAHREQQADGGRACSITG